MGPAKGPLLWELHFSREKAGLRVDFSFAGLAVNGERRADLSAAVRCAVAQSSGCVEVFAGKRGMAVGGMRAEKEEEGGEITPEAVSVLICAHTADPVWSSGCLLEPCGDGLGTTGRKSWIFPTFCATKG